MKIELKYGKNKIKIDVPSSKLKGVYKPKDKPGTKDVYQEIIYALSSSTVLDLLKYKIKTKSKVAIVVDDITRPLPSKDILPPLIDELTFRGIKKENVTIIIGTGLHRKLTRKEILQLLGEKIAGNIRVMNHDPYDKKNLSYLGRTSQNTDIYVNKIFAQADIKVLVGDIEYHHFFGYGGGLKSLHPGIADAESIRKTHSQLESSMAKASILKGNPLQQEVKEVAQMIKVDFILDVVLNLENQVIKAFAGDISEIFSKGVKLVDKVYKIKIPYRTDTVIVSCGGFPRDINLYQSQKAIEQSKNAVKEGGKLILFAQCNNEWGSEIFQKWMEEAEDPKEVIDRLKKNFVIGGHKAYLLAKVVQWADVYLYSQMNPGEIRKAFVYPLSCLEDVKDIINNSKEIIVLPFGTVTLPLVP